MARPKKLRNRRGEQISVDLISQQEVRRHHLVMDLIKEAKSLQQIQKKVKARIDRKIKDFIRKSYTDYGVKYGGDKKGNFSLFSYDEQYKVLVVFPDVVSYNEQIRIARDLFVACLREWTENGRPELVAFMEEVMQLDKQSRIDRRFISKVRKIKSDDPRWTQGVEVLLDSMNITTGKAYIRFFEQSRESFKMERIPLNFSEL